MKVASDNGTAEAMTFHKQRVKRPAAPERNGRAKHFWGHKDGSVGEDLSLESQKTNEAGLGSASV